MSKAILLSIQPKWIEKILNGEKTIEIRKSMPKCNLPIDVYIYCTKDKKYSYTVCEYQRGKVVAKFTLNRVKTNFVMFGGIVNNKNVLNEACIKFEELEKYLNGSGAFYEWHIDNLQIFDKPMKLEELRTFDKTLCNSFGWAFSKDELYPPLTRLYGGAWRYVKVDIKDEEVNV